MFKIKYIKMKIVIICILKLIYISTVSTQNVSQGVPKYVCEYVGVDISPPVDLKTTAADVPKRCELVTYGYYYIDGVNMDDINMYKNDVAAIKSMVAAGRPVYTYVSYNGTEKWTDEIFEPKDPATYDKIVNPLIQKLKDVQPTGIILNIVNFYDKPDYANKIKTFINKLKQPFPKLKFGLTIYAEYGYKNLSNKALFDFSVTDSIIDLYFVDTNINQFKCTPKLAKGGTPITSPDKNELTFETLTTALTQSGVDKAKTIISYNIFPLYDSQNIIYSPYSKYCDDNSTDKAGMWCIDKAQKLHDVGAFMKKQNFGGIAIDWMEWDDIPGSCQCDAFPVSNTVFDGWDGKPLKPCPKIS